MPAQFCFEIAFILHHSEEIKLEIQKALTQFFIG